MSGKSTDGCAVLMNLWMCGGVTVWTHRANGISSELHSADLETGISRMTHRPQVWEKKDRKRNKARETDRERTKREWDQLLTFNEHTAHTSCICTHIVVYEYCVNGLLISYACHFLPFMPMCPSGTGCETDGGGVDKEREL